MEIFYQFMRPRLPITNKCPNGQILELHVSSEFDRIFYNARA